MRRVLLKWITQRVLLTSALVKSLVFAPLFNSQKACFELFWAWSVVARAPQRTVEGRGFIPLIFILFRMPEEHIIRTYHLRSYVILYLLQETRSHATPALSKPSFLWPLFFFNVGYRGFFISFIASLCLVYCVDLSLKPLNRMFSTTLINALKQA